MHVVQIFDLLIALPFVLLWVGLIAFLRLKKKKSKTYCLLFTIFYIYLYKVLDYTLIQFQSLLLLKYFVPNLILRGDEAHQSINLIPLFTLTQEDIKTSLLNILLFIPFGFGMPFIADWRTKKIVVVGAMFSVMIELLQLITGVLAQTSFRVLDINDVIFNTLGTVVGSALYIGIQKIISKYTAQENI